MAGESKERMSAVKIAALALAGVVVVVAAYALLGGAPADPQGPKATLNIFTWSDYFSDELIREFEARHHCRVVRDVFGSNEEAHVRIEGGATGWDIVTPSSYMASAWRKRGWLMDLDPNLLPHRNEIDPAFLAYTEDQAMAYGVPYTRTVTGVGYDTEHVGMDPDPSWAIFADDRFRNRMTLLDDPRETLAAALKFLNATKAQGQPGRYDINTLDDAEIEEATQLLIQWKTNLNRFATDPAKAGLEDGAYFAVQQYNGDIAQMMEENPRIRFFVPKEGSSIASDDFVILQGARNPALAHAFIDFMLEPENAARNMRDIRYYMPNPKGLAALRALDPALADNPAFNIEQDQLARCSVLRDLGEGLEKYTRAYERVRGAATP